ncbi:MAG: RagB/SusD family nutrient uptake outer membrane protein [Butyricimonas faecihominis]
MSKEGAMALKARVLLYQASPLFNGNEFYVNFKGKKGEPLFSMEYDPERWKRAAEAADAAVEFCESLGYRLNTGEQNKPTKLLNQMRDVEMSIWEREYDGVEAVFLTGSASTMFGWFQYLLPRFPEGHPDRDANLFGCVGPSMKMVEMFYTKNGLPISMDKEWSYPNRYKLGRELNNDYEGVIALNEDVLNLHLKREPRFYANIAADRCYWQRGNRAGDNKLVEAYRGEAFGLQRSYIWASEPQNTCGYYVKKFVRSEVQTYSYMYNAQTLRDSRYPVISLAELYLIQAEAWNEYEGPSDKVYEPLNKVRERAGIPDVKTSWERYSYSPPGMNTGECEIYSARNAVEFVSSPLLGFAALEGLISIE